MKRSMKLRQLALLLVPFLATAVVAEGNDKADDLRATQIKLGSSLAFLAAGYVREARELLDKDQPAKARDQVIKATALLEAVKSEADKPVVKARLERAGEVMEVEPPERVEAELMPVYAELDVITDGGQNRQAKRHLKKAIKAVRKGDREKARAELREIDKLVVVKTVAIPIDSTLKHLEGAITAIDHKDLGRAKEQLGSAHTSIHTELVAFLDKDGRRAGEIIQTGVAE